MQRWPLRGGDAPSSSHHNQPPPGCAERSWEVGERRSCKTPEVKERARRPGRRSPVTVGGPGRSHVSGRQALGSSEFASRGWHRFAGSAHLTWMPVHPHTWSSQVE